MSHAKEIKHADLRELLRLHWEHVRHIETERYWFMSIYSILTAGILAIIFKSDSTKDADGIFWLFMFLTVLTVIGFLQNIRWFQAIELHRNQIKETAKLFPVEVVVDIPYKSIGKVEIGRIISTRILFPLFYFTILIGITIYLNNPVTDWIIIIVSLIALVIIRLPYKKQKNNSTKKEPEDESN